MESMWYISMTKSKETHLVSLFIDRNTAGYADFFCNWIYSSRTIKQNQR